MKYGLTLTAAALALAAQPKVGEGYRLFAAKPSVTIARVGVAEQTAHGDAFATVDTLLTGNNNDLTFTAATGGSAGNSITITYVDPMGNDAVLSVTVVGSAITVHLATGAGGAISSTAALIAAAIQNSAAAAALVTVANKTGNDGTGVVTAMASTPLVGGGNGTLAVASYDADATFTPPAGGGCDLQCVLLSPLPASVVTVLTFNAVLSDGTTATATATFSPPAYAEDAAPHLPQGIAVDLVPSDPTKSIRSVTSLATIIGGYTGVQFGILRLPGLTDWTEIPDIVQKDVTAPVRGTTAIASGFNPAKYIVASRGQVPNVSISQRYASWATGLARYAGQRTVFRLECHADGTALVERMVFQSILNLTNPRPDAGEVVATAAGIAEHLAVFV